MGGREEGHDRAEARAEVLVTIHGRVFAGVLRRGRRSPEHDESQWCVEIQVDDRRVMTWVAPDQVEFVGRGGTGRA